MRKDFWKEKRILIVEDEKELAHLVGQRFTSEGYRFVQQAHSVREAFDKMETFAPDILLLDIMLLDGSGYEIAQYIQQQAFPVPILFLTAKDQKEDILQGFRMGGDDYMVKPFSVDELMLRTEAILKRVYRKSDRMYLENSTVDFDRGVVEKNGQEIMLTAKEIQLLKKLAVNAGRIVTTDALMEAMWGENTFGYENSLNMHIRRVRQKIEKDPSRPVSLMTIRSIGYKLVEKCNES